MKKSKNYEMLPKSVGESAQETNYLDVLLRHRSRRRKDILQNLKPVDCVIIVNCVVKNIHIYCIGCCGLVVC